MGTLLQRTCNLVVLCLYTLVKLAKEQVRNIESIQARAGPEVLTLNKRYVREVERGKNLKLVLSNILSFCTILFSMNTVVTWDHRALGVTTFHEQQRFADGKQDQCSSM